MTNSNKASITSKLALIIFLVASAIGFSKDVPKPDIMLAKSYSEGIDLSQYWVSEKYDGVRALWDGKQFISRGGNIYHAPEWFTEYFPEQRLDGELWIARQSFELLVSTVRDRKPDDDAWKKVKYMVFDLPDAEDIFDIRLNKLNLIINESQIPWLETVKQIKVTSHRALMAYLEEITNAGAEGLMLHKGSSYYRGKRSSDLLKVKPFEDAEAVVISHIAGKGKHEGRLGALLVKLSNGIEFKLGSGFTDAERESPPKIGTIITYRFRGKTKNGIPRFASYLRIRSDINQ